jgi:hypothetical protein
VDDHGVLDPLPVDDGGVGFCSVKPSLKVVCVRPVPVVVFGVVWGARVCGAPAPDADCEAEVWALGARDGAVVVAGTGGDARCAGLRAGFEAARAGTAATAAGARIANVRVRACCAAALVVTTFAGVFAWCGATR